MLADRMIVVGRVIRLEHRNSGRWKRARVLRLDYRMRRNHRGNWRRSYRFFIRLHRPMQGVPRSFWISLEDIDEGEDPDWDDYEWE